MPYCFHCFTLVSRFVDISLLSPPPEALVLSEEADAMCLTEPDAHSAAGGWLPNLRVSCVDKASKTGHSDGHVKNKSNPAANGAIKKSTTRVPVASPKTYKADRPTSGATSGRSGSFTQIPGE